MSMRDSFPLRTICEILREINDLAQSDSDQDRITREKLAIAQKMAKKMSEKLSIYSKKIGIENKRINVEENNDYNEDVDRRTNPKYKAFNT